jgi:electron transfer flavoprotein beta subunit
MPLKIITLAKQVPDTANITGDAMKPDGTVNRAALPAITNPEDLNALEEALKIKETFGATITTITLGPPGAVKTLKEALYRGANDAILITDPKFAASDTLATSYALKCAVEKIGKFDLILCGRQAIDGDTAQVGPQLAQKLNINQLSNIIEIIQVSAKNITVKRMIDGGTEVVKTALPALLTIITEANEPRSPSIKRVMLYKNIACKNSDAYDETYLDSAEKAEKKVCTHIKQWNADDIKAELKRCGLSGSPTKVKKIENVVLTARNTRAISNAENEIGALIHELVSEHIIG